MGLKTLSFLTLVLPSLYILLSSLSLPNLAQAEPAQPESNTPRYLMAELSSYTGDPSNLAKLDKDIGSNNTKATGNPTILDVQTSKGVGFIATVSTNKTHSNLTREKTNSNDQDNQAIKSVQASYDGSNITHCSQEDQIEINQSGGSALTNDTWGFLPLIDYDRANGSYHSCGDIGDNELKTARFYQVPAKDNPVTLSDIEPQLGEFLHQIGRASCRERV